MNSAPTSQNASSRPAPGPRGRAQLRHLERLFRDPHSALDELRDEFGPIVGLGVGPLHLVVVGDPDLMHDMFMMDADSFRWGHKFNAVGVRFVVGPGSMIVSDGADHHRRRRSVQAAFTRKRLSGWIPMILQRTDTAIDSAVESAANTDGPVDLYPIGRNLVLTVAVHAFFGGRLAERAREIGGLMQRPQDFLEASALKQLPHPFPFTARSRVRADRRALDRIIDGEIARHRSQSSGDPLDILETLVRDGSLTDAEVRDQVATLIGAGFDTTSAVLAWTLWCGALCPATWSRLRSEADEVLGPVDQPIGSPDNATLARLEYAGRVIHETLRLHPAGAIGAREAAIDIHLGGHLIRKGTLVVWSPHLAGRDPGAWPDPLRFDPDRFVDVTPQQKAISDQAWVPFGHGPHSCIGFALAQMELTLMISRIAQRLDLTATSKVTPRPVGLVVNRPVGGAPFYVRRRSDDVVDAGFTG